MKYSVGIDIGTSACKTVIIDTLGDIVASASKEYFAREEDGNAFQNPNDWFNAVIETINHACKNGGIDPKDICAVGCTGQAQSSTFLDREGNSLGESLLWFGSTAVEKTEAVAKKFAGKFEDHCHMGLATTRTLSKLFWILENDPGRWEKTDKVLFTSAYIVYRLTGEIIADSSNITLSSLNDVATNQWCDELVEQFIQDKEKLPSPVIGSEQIAGKTTEKIARLTGIPKGTPVIAGCADVTAECYALNLCGKSQLKLRLGSCGAANAVFDGSSFVDDRKICSPYLSDKGKFLGRYTMACARSVKYARDTFFSELEKNDHAYEIMDSEAVQSPRGAKGLLFHPFLNGEDHPYHDPLLKAKLVGMDTTQNRGDIVRAVYEGVSFSLRDMIESEPYFDDLHQILFVGGGTLSKVWLPLLADVLGRPGVVPVYGDASFGVGLMAGDAVGILDGCAAAERSKAMGKQVDYDPSAHEFYNERFEKYKKLALIEKGILW